MDGDGWATYTFIVGIAMLCFVFFFVYLFVWGAALIPHPSPPSPPPPRHPRWWWRRRRRNRASSQCLCDKRVSPSLQAAETLRFFTCFVKGEMVRITTVNVCELSPLWVLEGWRWTESCWAHRISSVQMTALWSAASHTDWLCTVDRYVYIHNNQHSMTLHGPVFHIWP